MKNNFTRNAMANAMAVLLGAAVWHGAVQAADPVPDYMLYYTGEREFCMHLLRNADKAEKIDPVIGPTYAYDLDIGDKYAPKTRLYIAKSPMPDHVIHRMVKERKWKSVLGYTPWKADSTAGRMIYDSRWRKYDDQCPGIFQIRHYKDRSRIIDTPTQMTLYDFDADADGDGKRDMIYRHQFDYTGHYFAVADFKTCTLKPIVGHRAESKFFRFEDKTYLIAGFGISMVWVYRINTPVREIDSNNPNDVTCFISGIDRFNDHIRNTPLIHKFTYRK